MWKLLLYYGTQLHSAAEFDDVTLVNHGSHMIQKAMKSDDVTLVTHIAHMTQQFQTDWRHSKLNQKHLYVLLAGPVLLEGDPVLFCARISLNYL
jgi:hypothetical protein